jgi:hypothetical protein
MERQLMMMIVGAVFWMKREHKNKNMKKHQKQTLQKI